MRRLFRLDRGARAVPRDVEDELRLHLELRAAELVAEGWNPEAARAEAARLFGSVDAHRTSCLTIDRERARTMRRTDTLDALRQDVVFAVRAFRRRPLFTAAAVAVLALGIGANTAVFSLVNAVLLRPLPYDDVSSLVLVSGGDESGSFHVSERERLRYRAERGVFDGFATWAFGTLVLTGEGNPERVPTAFIDHELFAVAGIRPQLGRGFSSEEDRPGGPDVVVLSHGFWTDRMGGDSAAVGRVLTIDGSAATIVGVLPRDARLPGDFARPSSGLYTPIAHSASPDPQNIHYLDAMARLAPGVDGDRLAARLAVVARELTEEIEQLPRNFQVRTESVTSAVLGDSRANVLLLVAAVGLLLLLACANVAGLLLAQAESRQREFAVRVALGAGPGRLIRQLATESLVLGAIGGAAGLAFGYVALDALLALSPAGLPRADTVSVDGVVTGFAVLATLVTAVLFGLAPGLNVRRRSAQSGLAAESRSATGGRSGHRLRRGLVLAEVGLAVTITAGAGFVARRWVDLVRTEPGFEVAGSLTAQLSLPGAAYAAREARWRFYDQAVSAVDRLPGVSAAGAVSVLPVAQSTGDWGFLIEGRPPVPPGERNAFADRLIVTPGYFEAMRIPLRRGRFLERADDAGRPPVVLLSESVANRYWPGSDPVGTRIQLTSDIDPVWRTIVGIVGDVRSRGLEEAARSEFYFPHGQFPASANATAFGTMNLVVRTAGDPAAIAPAVRAAIGELDAGIPVSLVRTMADVLDGSLAVRRLQLLLLAFFAVSGLALVAVGVYGVVAFLAERRTREFGVRMALGADRGGIVRLVLRDGARLGLVGGVFGLVGAVGAGRLLQGALAGVSPWDPVVLAGVPLLVFGIVVAATLVPAIRAAHRDPGATLRAE